MLDGKGGDLTVRARFLEITLFHNNCCYGHGTSTPLKVGT